MFYLKRVTRLTLFLILSISIILNSVSLWMGNRDVAAVIISSSRSITTPGSISSFPLITTPGSISSFPLITPQGAISSFPLITPQGVISSSGNNFVVAQSSTTNANLTCTSPLVSTLILTKQVLDPNRIDTGGLFTNFPFRIIVNDNGVHSTFIIHNGQNSQFCLTPGAIFSVSEDTSFIPTKFQFSTSLSGTCSGTAPQAGQIISCTINNTINSITGGIVNSTANSILFPQSASTPSPTDKQSIETVTPQAAVTPANTIPNSGNPPFKTCLSTLKTTTNPSGSSAETTFTDLEQAPSSATYVVEGDIPLENVRHAMFNLDTNKFTIQVLSDLQQNSNKVALTLSAPLLAGNIIVQSDDGAKQKVIPFAITNVRTECHYITLAKAVGPNSNSAIAPIGGINTPTQNIKAPDTNKLLIGGTFVTKGDQINGMPGILNPPFGRCDTTGTPAGAQDDIALYNIMGATTTFNNNNIAIWGHHLVMEITVDLLQNKNDLAKIPNNNNPFVRVNLIADKNENTGHIIPFTLDNLNTDCKNIATTNSQIFKPITGEFIP